uniref:Uncharacterized protein n=1 Tax=Panagrolaimus sp. ES5 TaxID=591445 RepID=A0AC34F887_9BILA
MQKKSQKVVEEKEKQISELKNLNNVQQNELILKAERKAKDLGDQLIKSQSNFLTAKVQAENWKSKSINIQAQLEALQKTTAEEKENCKKRVQKLKAENEQLLLTNANVKAEKEKVEKKLADFQLAATSKTLQLRKINDENHSKLNEALCDKNDTILTSFMEGPKWIVSKEICQAIYDSNPKLIDFLKHFTLRLFSPTEILLSERTLDSAKWKEAKAVIFHFFKPGDQKAVYVNLLQKEMQTKRYLARTKAYGHCVPNRRAIGFADTGKVYFFQLQANNNQWTPFADEECQVPAMFKTFENCLFGFPKDLPPPEFIVIVSLQKNVHGIYKFTSAGYLEGIFTKANNGGEKKASNN